MKSKKITESNIDDSIFNANSGEWWIEDGAFKALHSFNLIRTKFLTDAIKSYPNNTLKNKKILAKLGQNVVAGESILASD